MNEVEEGPLRLLGIAGSLRRASYNRALLRAAKELADDSITMTFHDLRDVPLYDADVESRGDPAAVEALKRAIAGADALLIATPEYQHSIPGVLKNALDWASRPRGESVLNGKPAAILGATPGRGATARAQSDLRKVLAYSRMHVYGGSSVLIPNAAEVFDDEGRLSDEDTRRKVRETVDGLAAWTRWLVRCPPPAAS